MKIEFKRLFFTIILCTGIAISMIMNNQAGFYASGSIVCLPLILGFFITLFLPNIVKNDEKSMYISVLLVKEKVYAAIDFLLIILWIVVQIRCL